MLGNIMNGMDNVRGLLEATYQLHTTEKPVASVQNSKILQMVIKYATAEFAGRVSRVVL